ncbi:uncharacterized protein [Hemitrygon akajei]|uniref:uncharacterized protein n=1 Tax=Hemitrygon akajei TaxID=2704970 RepID=UPI003BF9C875
MDVDEFIENPTLEALEAATKSELINIAKGLSLAEVRLSMKKREVRRAITQYYIVKDVFSAEVLENIPEKVPASGTAQLELEKLRLEHEIKLKQLEAAEKEKERAEKEKERAEREKERADKQREHALQLKELEVKREQERAEKQREHEVQLKQLEAAEKERERAEKEKERAEKEREAEKQRQHDLDMEKLRQERRAQGSDREERFNVSRELRLVPPFEETDVDSYFLLFEKVAVNQKWPKEQWVALLQSVLKGKAQRAYAALSMEEEEAENYDKVKEAILRTYELVPEAYRQKFRNLKKGWNQMNTEFAYEKGVLLDRWCTAETVEEDFWRLRELILIEEFKGCVSEDIRMYLNEKPNKSISEFARFADEYALTHKTKFS